MGTYKVIEIKKSILEDNKRKADLMREDFKREKTFVLNLMSSPGSGKTTTVLRTIEALKNELRIGVLEADIDSDVDAYAVAQTDTKVVQLHTGGMCRLSADMTKEGMTALGTADLDFVIIENIGNLICTAECDTGAAKKAMILSVPEGDDKPLKYPVMFSVVDVLLINKIDAMDYFDFNMEAVVERVTALNPNVKIIPISARTGEGIDQWADWIRNEVMAWNETV